MRPLEILVLHRLPLRPTDLEEPAWRMVQHHHNLTFNDGRSWAIAEPDVIVSGSVTLLAETIEARLRFPKAKLACYLWDAYSWCFKAPAPPRAKVWYDYTAYVEVLKAAHAVWVPSECTARRADEWWGIKTKVIKTYCPGWDHPTVSDDGYALMCLREQPDAKWGMFERCCRELGIPFVTPLHQMEESEYRDAVAHCRFICAPLDELSTV